MTDKQWGDDIKAGRKGCVLTSVSSLTMFALSCIAVAFLASGAFAQLPVGTANLTTAAPSSKCDSVCVIGEKCAVVTLDCVTNLVAPCPTKVLCLSLKTPLTCSTAACPYGTVCQLLRNVECILGLPCPKVPACVPTGLLGGLLGGLTGPLDITSGLDGLLDKIVPANPVEGALGAVGGIAGGLPIGRK